MARVREGSKIRMRGLMDDPDPIPVGTEGTVTGVWGEGKMEQIGVEWDIQPSRSLMLLPRDPFTVLKY